MWVLNWRTSAHDLRWSRSHPPMVQRGHTQHPRPRPTSLPRAPVRHQLPVGHLHKSSGHEIVSLGGTSHGCVTRTGLPPLLLASAPRLVRWTSRGLLGTVAVLCSTQTLPRPWPSFRPLLRAPGPEAQAAPGSVTRQSGVSQEVPAMEGLMP